MNDKELIIKWLDDIIQKASDRKTANGIEMSPEDTLNEIKVLAKDAKEYIDKFVTSDPIKKGEDFLKTRFKNDYYTVVYSGTLDDLIWEYKNWMEI